MNFNGSIKGRRVINRDRVSGARLLHKDCFASDPTFPDDPWPHCRFHMRKPLSLHIVEGVEAHDDYFKVRGIAAANFLSLLRRNGWLL